MISARNALKCSLSSSGWSALNSTKLTLKIKLPEAVRKRV